MLFHLSRRKREEQPGTTLPCQISFYFFLQVVALQVSRLNMADFLEDEAMESEEEAVGSGYLLIDFFVFYAATPPRHFGPTLLTHWRALVAYFENDDPFFQRVN